MHTLSCRYHSMSSCGCSDNRWLLHLLMLLVLGTMPAGSEDRARDAMDSLFGSLAGVAPPPRSNSVREKKVATLPKATDAHLNDLFASLAGTQPSEKAQAEHQPPPPPQSRTRMRAEREFVEWRERGSGWAPPAGSGDDGGLQGDHTPEDCIPPGGIPGDDGGFQGDHTPEDCIPPGGIPGDDGGTLSLPFGTDVATADLLPAVNSDGTSRPRGAVGNLLGALELESMATTIANLCLHEQRQAHAQAQNHAHAHERTHERTQHRREQQQQQQQQHHCVLKDILQWGESIDDLNAKRTFRSTFQSKLVPAITRAAASYLGIEADAVSIVSAAAHYEPPGTVLPPTTTFHSNGNGAMAMEHNGAAGIVALSVGESSINTNFFHLSDPRTAAAMTALPEWFGTGTTVAFELRPGHLQLSPPQLQRFITRNDDPDSARIYITFKAVASATFTKPQPPRSEPISQSETQPRPEAACRGKSDAACARGDPHSDGNLDAAVDGDGDLVQGQGQGQESRGATASVDERGGHDGRDGEGAVMRQTEMGLWAVPVLQRQLYEGVPSASPVPASNMPGRSSSSKEHAAHDELPGRRRYHRSTTGNDPHDDLNRDLTALLLAISKEEESVYKSNKGGYQSSPTLFERTEPAILKLRDAVYDGVAAYLRLGPAALGRLGADDDAPNSMLEVEVHSSWFGLNKPGDSNSPHVHPASSVSGVYYVACPAHADPDGSNQRSLSDGKLHLLDPRGYGWAKGSGTHGGAGARAGAGASSGAGAALHSAADVVVAMASGRLEQVITPKAGKLVLFPSYLEHWVEPFVAPHAMPEEDQGYASSSSSSNTKYGGSSNDVPRIAVAFNVRVKEAPEGAVQTRGVHVYIPSRHARQDSRGSQPS